MRIAKQLLGLSAALMLIVNPFAYALDKNSPQRVCSDADIISAFTDSANGWSVDEVLLHDERRRSFFTAVTTYCPDVNQKEAFESLVRLRKAGKLEVRATKRSAIKYHNELAAAEIAARQIQDEYAANMDDVLIDPELLSIFDELATEILPKANPYVLRKAALRLRKSRKLKPELLARVVDWDRKIETLAVADAIKRIDNLPEEPGVYIFRDSTGYLYIGQSNSLRKRLAKHLVGSDRESLADYLDQQSNDNQVILELHIFGKDSPAQKTVIREAYESELIRTREPRLNLRP